MPKQLQNHVYRYLKDKTFQSDDELYRYLILQVATIFAGAIHTFLFILMLSCRVSVLPWINLTSVVIFAVNFFVLVKRRTYLFSGLLISIEVIAYTFIASYILGGDNYNVLYLLIVMVMQIIVPYSGGWIRGVVLFATWLCAIGIVIYGFGGEVLVPVDDTRELVISVFNLCVAAIGIVVELLIGNTIRKVIAHFNEKRMQEFRTQANTDPLTGLYNRRYADMIFAHLRDTGGDTGWCVAILDIDDFKHVNDTYGHGVGDEVLCGLTEAMQKNLRRTDMVIRWGGEEFLILLGNVDLKTAHLILDKMRRSIEETTFPTEAGPIHITVTIGVVPLNVEYISESVVLCDAKLYSGKNNGKNRVAV